MTSQDYLFPHTHEEEEQKPETPISERILTRQTAEYKKVAIALSEILIQDQFTEQYLGELVEAFEGYSDENHIVGNKIVHIVIDDIGDSSKIEKPLKEIGAQNCMMNRDTRYTPPTREIIVGPELMRRVELQVLKRKLQSLLDPNTTHPDIEGAIQETSMALKKLGVTDTYLAKNFNY